MTDSQIACLIWSAPFLIIGLIFAIGHQITQSGEYHDKL